MKNFRTSKSTLSGDQNAWSLSISWGKLKGFSANRVYSITTLVQPLKNKYLMLERFLSGKALLIVIVIGILIVLVFQKYHERKNAEQDRTDCYTELNKEVNGVVVKAFFDENPNHKGFEIVFTNGTTYRPLYLTKWQPIVLNEGDSIYKRSGTFKVTVFRKRYEKPIIIVEDTINCNKLK